jgi:hypothetical protein
MNNSGDKTEVRETLENILLAASKATNESKENNEKACDNSSFEVLHSLSSGDESKALNKPSQDLAKENSIT